MLLGFAQTAFEFLAGGPRPGRVGIGRDVQDVQILFRFRNGPGFDQGDQRGAGRLLCKLASVCRKAITSRFPLLTRPGGQELQLTGGQLHGGKS